MAEAGVILAPLGVEAWALRGGDHSLRVIRCGVGPVRARRMAERLRTEPANTLAVAGLCGATDTDFEPGDLFVPDELRAPDQSPIRVEGEELRSLLAARGWRVHGGTLQGVDHGVTGEERTTLRETGASAVDMESPWLARAAGTRPFVVLRVVVDGPAHELLRIGTALRGWRALVRLRQASAALGAWAVQRQPS